MHKNISRIILLLVLCSTFSSAQTLTNLELFYQLADSSVGLINNPGSNCLKINSSGLFATFDNALLKAAGTKGLKICKETDSSVISYTIEKASMEYPLIFRDGFMGRYMTQRTAVLEGSYYTSQDGFKKFNISVTDTVAVEDVKNLENEAFPFTKGELPSEPLLSGLIEPVAAITTAAAIIVLYFTVRSR